MLKAYYFLWRRPGMSRAEFIEYYEERHASLIISNLLPASDFRRNYPRWSETHSTYVGAAPFDALTAITYPNRAQFEDSMHTYRSPPFSQIVTEDELRFIDRQRVRFVPVHEVVDRVNHDEWFPAPLEAGSTPGCTDYRRNYLCDQRGQRPPMGT